MLQKTLMLGKIGAGEEGDGRGWDGWMASPAWLPWGLDTNSVHSNKLFEGNNE